MQNDESKAIAAMLRIAIAARSVAAIWVFILHFAFIILHFFSKGAKVR